MKQQENICVTYEDFMDWRAAVHFWMERIMIRTVPMTTVVV